MGQIAALFIAFLAAALVAAGSAWVVDRSAAILFFAFFVTLAHAFILGVPAFLLLRRRIRGRLVEAVLVGATIGALPLALFDSFSGTHTGYSAWTGGTQTVKDGVRTAAGWIGHLKLLLSLAGLGALGGAAFWVSLRMSGYSTFDAPVSTMATATSGTLARRVRRAWHLLVPVVAATVLATPAIIKDRTCHNLFRDGGNSSAPVLGINLDAGNSDWPALKIVLQELAEKHRLSLRDSSAEPTDVMLSLHLSVCSDDGINIEVSELRFAHHNFQNIMRGRGIGVFTHAVRPQADWRAIARDLIGRLEQRWPGRVQFHDRNDRLTDRPNDL